MGYTELLVLSAVAVEKFAKLMFHLIQPLMEALISAIHHRHSIRIDASKKGEN